MKKGEDDFGLVIFSGNNTVLKLSAISLVVFFIPSFLIRDCRVVFV